jgi:hypothetical protein
VNVSIKVDVSQLARRDIFERFGPKRRTEMNAEMALGVREFTRNHLFKLSGERHATANRLGASPSGHLAQAVRAVEQGAIAADPAGATLTINHVGLGRAFHDVTITPSKKYLTLPIAAAAYNRRAGQLDHLFFFTSKGGNAFLAQRDPTAKGIKLMYLLKRSVTQKQDRSLLPSDEEWSDAAAEIGRQWIQMKTNSAASA